MPKQRKRVSIPEHSIGERIKFIRINRHLSQKDLAKIAKVSQATVAQIETGRKDPSLNTLRKIATALDTHAATLLADNNVHVFDLKRLRRKYSHVDSLTPALYMALGKVVQYAIDIKFIRK